MNQYVTGSIIRELREKKQMTQAGLAAALSVSAKKQLEKIKKPRHSDRAAPQHISLTLTAASVRT